MSQALKNPSPVSEPQFLTIPLASVPTNLELPYSVFVKIAERWILLRTKGDFIDQSRLDGLSAKKVACLGVLKSEWAAYISHLEARLDEVGVKEGNADSALRVRSLLHAYFREVEERRELTQDFLGKIKSTAEKMPVAIGKNRDVANGLLKRDPDASLYFSNHAVNTSIYSVAIGLKYGLDLATLQEAAFTGTVANLGIIKIPTNVLYKPGPLLDSEWNLVRQHPQLGRDILKLLLIVNPICEAVFSHSEKFDGSGYPRQLKGDEIPLSARIVSIAETFSALTSNRPWAAALPPHRAVEVLQRISGRFDPKILRLV